jgi:hypothetical protein
MISRGYKVIAMSREQSGVGGKKTMDDVKKDFEVCGCRPSPSHLVLSPQPHTVSATNQGAA